MSVILLDLPPPVEWSPWFVAVFFLAGLSVGGFVLALPGRAFGLQRWQIVSRLGLLLALAAGLAAPPCLLAALARPDRGGLLYARGEGSWLVSVVQLLPGYLAVLALFAWTTMRRDLAAAEGGNWLARLHRAASFGGGGAPGLRQITMFLTGGLGLGVLLMVAAGLRPAWDSPLLFWHLVLTGLAGALGAVLVLDRLAGEKTDFSPLLCRATAGVLALGMLLGRASWDSVAMATAIWTGLVALMWPARLGWLAGLLALAGSWAVRWGIVMAHTDLAGFGWLLAPLGMAGLLIVLLTGLAAVLPVLGPRRAGGG